MDKEFKIFFKHI